MCTDEFFALGKAEAEILGMPGLPIVTIPHPMARQKPERVAELAVQSVPEIIHILTTHAAGLEREYKAKTVISRAKLRYKTLFGDDFSLEKSPDKFKAPTSLEAINKLVYGRGWTDGLPIIPPAEERVKEMINHWGWNPQEIIGLLPPKRGEASVEKIAINAVMAGCMAEYLPVVIAATKAMIQKDFNLYGLQTTTHLCTVLVLVNGPLADELGINSGYNAMGQGNMANATIGRAIRLVLTNIGGASPGILDRATFGSPAKYSFCFAENEAENPWEPFHVERGFPKSISTVTVFGVEGPHNVNDHGSQSAEEILLTVSGVLATPGTNHIYLGGEPLIVLGPEHAQIIASDGFSKAEVKKFLYEKARVPLKLISRGNLERFRKIWPERFSGLGNGDSAPIAAKPEDILVIVAGGQGRHSAVIPSFGATKAITVPITDRHGHPIFVKERKSGTSRD
ncbi:MAG: hypothetical protein HY882_14545 [Deltaproteobacteria bacterium]|nr:hypothetical protein [Deltaproteobacteria bacterium]